MKNIKNKLRKYLSVERRDLWDSPRVYAFRYLSVDKLKYKLKHLPNKDSKMKVILKEALERRTRMTKDMEYIRKRYNVPAKRGMKVIAQRRNGIIVGARNGYLLIRIEGEKDILSFHPTWKMEYLKDE